MMQIFLLTKYLRKLLGNNTTSIILIFFFLRISLKQKSRYVKSEEMLISKEVNIKKCWYQRRLILSNVDIERNVDIGEWTVQFLRAIYKNGWN